VRRVPFDEICSKAVSDSVRPSNGAKQLTKFAIIGSGFVRDTSRSWSGKGRVWRHYGVASA